MRLSKIVVNDFRQFYGRNEIVFSQDNSKNITLIHGENGTGKTTLLNTVLWCFYERFTSDVENKHEIINIDAISNGADYASVDIYLSHLGKSYCISRQYNAKNKKSSLYVNEVEEGNFNFKRIKEITAASSFIESIIPSQMAGYFFFHGEGIAQLAKEEGFKEAIRNILGFSAAEYAIEDLESLSKNWGKERIKIQRRDSEYKSKLKEKEEVDDILKASLLRKKDINEKQERLIHRKSSLQNELLQIKTQDVSSIQKIVTRCEKEIASLEGKISECNIKAKRLIKAYGTSIFGFDLSKQTLADVEEQDKLGLIPAPYDESLINKLEKEEICICGRELIPGTEPFNFVMALRNTANTAEIKNRRLKAVCYISSLDKKPSNFSEAWGEIKDTEFEHRTKKKELEFLLEEKQVLLKKIGDGGHGEVSRINHELKLVSDEFETNVAQISRLDINIASTRARIDALAKHIAANEPNDEATSKLSSSILKVNDLIILAKEKLKEAEERSKFLIAKSVNDILGEFSRKDFSVKITNDLEYYLIRKDGAIVAKSKGENLLLNLAFISALIGFCYKRSTADGKFFIPGTVAPFFIDAPFGELDETYRAATASFLPKSCEQLVLLLSSSHWSGTVDSVIHSKVSKEYILQSHKKQYKGDKPDDLIVINGKEFKQSIYSSTFDGTIVVEVK